MRPLPLLLLVAMAHPVRAHAPAIQQQTAGPCSVAVSGNNNRVFTCQGLDEKKATEMLAILNRIAANQLDPAVVMKKLDDIQKSLSDFNETNYQRHVTTQQKQILLPLLKSAAPQELYFVCAPDPESQQYFKELSAVLSEAGWKLLVHPYNWGTIQVYPTGLLILVADTNKTPKGALALQTALGSAGIDAQGGNFEMVLPDKFALFVGQRPPAGR